MVKRRSYLDKWQYNFVEVSTQHIPCCVDSPMRFRTAFNQYAAILAGLRAEWRPNGSEDSPVSYEGPDEHCSVALPGDEAMQPVTLRFCHNLPTATTPLETLC